MKGKKNLEKTIVMGLMLSSITAPVWASDINSTTINTAGEGYSIKNTVTGVDNINIDITKGGTGLMDTTAGLAVWGGTIETTGKGDIFISDTTNEAGNNTALDVSHGGKAHIMGNKVFIRAQNSILSGFLHDDAVAATNDGYVEISGNTVQIIGSMDLTDNTGSKPNQIKAQFSSNDSFWYGDERQDSDRKGILDISLSNGAEWIYNSSPEISALTLNKNGIVNLRDDDIDKKSDKWNLNIWYPHQKVVISELKGTGGIFKVDLDWTTNNGQKVETDNSDYIFIGNSLTDSIQIIDFDASKANLDKMNVGDKLYFANVEDGNTKFTTTMGESASYSSASNIYNYQYGVGSDAEDDGTNADWYIGLIGKSAEGNANYESAKGAMYAGYALGTELDTLNKRMGEARYLGDDNGVWVRYRHAKTSWDDTFETNSNMFQLGFDNEVQEDDGTHYRGVAVDYTDADTSLMHASGDGENKRYAVSLYDTWVGEKGHYRDLVLRGGRINSDYDISGMFSNGMEDIGGDYHQWFGSISAEWGRKNNMESGWYFEPQTQLQLARVGGASYVSDSGIAVDQDGATSLIGRVGFRFGREYEKDNGKADNYYIKADLMHEFMGDKGIALSTATERYTDEYDGQETWFDIGLGADISIGKNSFFWADVERTLGADFDNTWQINGGFRWEF